MMPAFLRSRYYLKFNLDRDPFPQKSSQNKLFLTHELTALMYQLIGAIKSQEELMVVESKPGGGKSVLAEYLNYAKEANWYLSLVRASEKMSNIELAHAIISQHFPKHRFEKTQSGSILREFLQLYQRNSKLPVVVIDDAHLLPQETLKFVLELSSQRHEDAQFRIILFADKAIRLQFNLPSMKKTDSVALEYLRIPSFSMEQTAKYIEHRLSLSGHCNMSLFDGEAIKQIHEKSAGVPADIHKFAKQHMQDIVIPGRIKRNVFRATASIAAGLMMFVMVYAGMSDNGRQVATNSSVSIALELPNGGGETIVVEEKKVSLNHAKTNIAVKDKNDRKKTVGIISKKAPIQNNKNVLLADMKRQRDTSAMKIAKAKAKAEIRLQLATYDALALRISDVVQN